MTTGPYLIIGRSGQVAQALAAVGREGQVICAGRPGTDLRSRDSLARTIEGTLPSVVINAGAFTSVDGAESDLESARILNAIAPKALAELCAERGTPLIHMSTDCVFDGTLNRPYTETDPTEPIGVYGKTKLNGERAVAAHNPKHIIVRVSWVFSAWGSNFVKTMLELAKTRDEVTVVNDQIGSPTQAGDLAHALLFIASVVQSPDFSKWGTYHLTGMGETDRASQAEAIFEASRSVGGPTARVNGVPTSAYPTPAERPLNARMDCTKVGEVFGLQLPHWHDRLTTTVKYLASTGASQ